MGDFEAQAADVRAPVGSAPTAADRIADGSGGEDSSGPLTAGAMATIYVGSQAIRVVFAAAATTVASTDLRLPAGTRFDFYVTEDVDDFVSAEADDASTSWEAWVWTSSGPRA